MIDPKGNRVSLLHMFVGEHDGSQDKIMERKSSVEELAEKNADGYTCRGERDWEQLKESYLDGRASLKPMLLIAVEALAKIKEMELYGGINQGDDHVTRVDRTLAMLEKYLRDGKE